MKTLNENQAPYIAVTPQFGRPFTIRHCVNCGQRLMVDPLDFILNIDKDVICKHCKALKEISNEEER